VLHKRRGTHVAHIPVPVPGGSANGFVSRIADGPTYVEDTFRIIDGRQEQLVPECHDAEMVSGDDVNEYSSRQGLRVDVHNRFVVILLVVVGRPVFSVS